MKENQDKEIDELFESILDEILEEQDLKDMPERLEQK